MSDFDKEAEREKLREKYGEEEQKREATEQMSELLLKGATMTNAHCTDCGDPIFRYDGQEFCPTCQKPVARDTDESDDDHIEVADPSDDATVQFGADDGEGTAEQADGDAAETAASGEPTAQHSESADGPAAEAAESTAPTSSREIPSADPDRSPPETGTQPTRDAPADGHSVDGSRPPSRSADEGVTTDLSAAESLLAETVHRFTQRAAESEDPRRAREYLGAAREAAETLDAVRFLPRTLAISSSSGPTVGTELLGWAIVETSRNPAGRHSHSTTQGRLSHVRWNGSKTPNAPSSPGSTSSGNGRSYCRSHRCARSRMAGRTGTTAVARSRNAP